MTDETESPPLISRDDLAVEHLMGLPSVRDPYFRLLKRVWGLGFDCAVERIALQFDRDGAADVAEKIRKRFRQP